MWDVRMNFQTAGVHREAFVHRADNDLINMQRQIKTAEQRHRKN